MDLYNRIKLRREELNMSQDELAQKLGYKSRSSINKIELGKSDIPQSKIPAFADALNTTPAYLTGWLDSPINISTTKFSDIMDRFKKIFLQLRLSKGFNQEEMSKELGISKSTIAMWETGKRFPSPDMVELIADYFNVDIDYLYGRTDVKKKVLCSEFRNEYINNCQSNSKSNNEEYRNVFVRKLNYYMALNGKKQIDLINDLGLSSATVSSWCTGAKLPRMDKIQMLANYLGIEKSDLIEEKSRQKSIFTPKKDISEILSDTEALLNQKGLILDGELANEESIIYIISAMKVGLELAKTNNKKYISNE